MNYERSGWRVLARRDAATLMFGFWNDVAGKPASGKIAFAPPLRAPNGKNFESNIWIWSLAMRFNRSTPASLFLNLLIVACTLILTFPLVWIVMMSVKQQAEVMKRLE